MNMKRTAAALLAVVTMAATAAAQAPAWVTYRSPDGQFSARFPTPPTTSTEQSKTSDGQPLTRHTVSAIEGESMFMLTHFDILPGQTFSLTEARDGIVRNLNGTLLSETAISTGAYRGSDLVVTAVVQGNAHVTNFRVVHTPRRVYGIQVVFSRTAPYQSEKTAQFFSSLQISQ